MPNLAHNGSVSSSRPPFITAAFPRHATFVGFGQRKLDKQYNKGGLSISARTSEMSHTAEGSSWECIEGKHGCTARRQARDYRAALRDPVLLLEAGGGEPARGAAGVQPRRSHLVPGYLQPALQRKSGVVKDTMPFADAPIGCGPLVECSNVVCEAIRCTTGFSHARASQWT